MTYHNPPTLFKRPNSRYWWFSLYTDTGRTQRSCKKLGLTVKDFPKEKALEILIPWLNTGSQIPAAGEETLQWFFKETDRRLFRENKREGTVKLYRDSIKRLIDIYNPDYPLKEIRRSDVGKLQDHLLAKGIGRVYINLICRHIRAALERLYDDEILERNPFRKFKPLDEDIKTKKYMNKEEVQKFLNSVATDSNIPLRRLIYLYLFTGRRCTEILNIHRDDITLTKNDNGQEIYLVRIENNKDRKRAKQLIEIPGEIHKTFKWFMERSGNSEHPFKICHPHSVSRMAKKHIRAAGLPDSYHLHSLRHTFVTHALKQGENIWKIKEQLGHSTVKVTELYAHDKPEGEIIIGFKLPEHVETKKH